MPSPGTPPWTPERHPGWAGSLLAGSFPNWWPPQLHHPGPNRLAPREGPRPGPGRATPPLPIKGCARPAPILPLPLALPAGLLRAGASARSIPDLSVFAPLAVGFESRRRLSEPSWAQAAMAGTLDLDKGCTVEELLRGCIEAFGECSPAWNLEPGTAQGWGGGGSSGGPSCVRIPQPLEGKPHSLPSLFQVRGFPNCPSLSLPVSQTREV